MQSLKRAQSKTIEKFLYAQNSRSKNRIDYIVDSVKEAVPLTEDSAVIQAHELQAMTLMAQIEITIKGIAQYDAAIKEVSENIPDLKLFKALPGAGPCLSTRLLAAARHFHQAI